MEKLKIPQFIRPGIGEHVPVGHGVKATYFRIGVTGLGYKQTRSDKIPPTVEEATAYAAGLQRDYEFINRYLNPYALPTQFVLGRDEDGALAIAGLQPDIENGMSIKQALKLAKREGLSIAPIVDLYRKAVIMHQKTLDHDIPDFNGTGRFLGWHRPNSTRNVIVTLNNFGELWPNVVDVGLISENRFTERIHKEVLARSILHQFNELKSAA